jgi:hypothetical protein
VFFVKPNGSRLTAAANVLVPFENLERVPKELLEVATPFLESYFWSIPPPLAASGAAAGEASLVLANGVR